MELISREAAMEAVAPWEFDTDEGKAARLAAQDNIRALPVWKPKGNYCVSAIAQNGIKIGYRMRFVSAASEAEAIGRAIMAFKGREPDWSFSEPSALLVFADLTQSCAAQAPAVKVKPLVWENDRIGPDHAISAHNGFSRWVIITKFTGMNSAAYRRIVDGEMRDYDTLEAAKAAAQADYESRILAALDLS